MQKPADDDGTDDHNPKPFYMKNYENSIWHFLFITRGTLKSGVSDLGWSSFKINLLNIGNGMFKANVRLLLTSRYKTLFFGFVVPFVYTEWND